MLISRISLRISGGTVEVREDVARSARHIGAGIWPDRPGLLSFSLRRYRSRPSVLDADRSAARGRDGGTMRERELYALSQQQSKRHYQLRYPADFWLEPAVLDLQLQHAGLRKSGERKLYIPVSRDLQRRPANADSEGVFSGLTMIFAPSPRLPGPVVEAYCEDCC
jgi:hypothetical protein